MKFEYTLTPDDVRESLAEPQSRRDAIWGSLVGFAALLALAVPLAMGTMGQESPDAVAAATAAPPRDVWVTLSPSLVGVTLVAGSTLLSRRRLRRPDGLPASSSGAWGWAILVLAFAWFIPANVPALAIPWHPTLRRELWAAVAPWFAYLIFTCIMALTAARHTASLLWHLSRSMRQPTTLELSGDGIMIVAADVEQRLRWSYIARYRATTNLLLLQTEDAGPIILPKRAIPDAGTEARLRTLIQTHVTEGTFLPRTTAFPVAANPLPPEQE